MNKVYNKFIYNNYYKVITVTPNTVIEPGQYQSFSLNTSSNYSEDPTENKNKIPIVFGEPIAFKDDTSDPSIGRCDKIPVDLFCRVYYTVLQPSTKKIRLSIFAKNFTDEPISFNGFYLPIINTEYDLMY